MKKFGFKWCVAEKANYIPLPARLGGEEYLLCFDGSCTWPELWVGEDQVLNPPPPFLLIPPPPPLSPSTLLGLMLRPALQIFSAIQHSNTELELPGHGNFPQIEMSVLCLQKYVKEVLLKSALSWPAWSVTEFNHTSSRSWSCAMPWPGVTVTNF